MKTLDRLIVRVYKDSGIKEVSIVTKEKIFSILNTVSEDQITTYYKLLQKFHPYTFQKCIQYTPDSDKLKRIVWCLNNKVYRDKIDIINQNLDIFNKLIGVQPNENTSSSGHTY